MPGFVLVELSLQSYGRITAGTCYRIKKRIVNALNATILMNMFVITSSLILVYGVAQKNTIDSPF
jgi:hypothetical protein